MTLLGVGILRSVGGQGVTPNARFQGVVANRRFPLRSTILTTFNTLSYTETETKHLNASFGETRVHGGPSGANR